MKAKRWFFLIHNESSQVTDHPMSRIELVHQQINKHSRISAVVPSGHRLPSFWIPLNLRHPADGSQCLQAQQHASVAQPHQNFWVPWPAWISCGQVAETLDGIMMPPNVWIQTGVLEHLCTKAKRCKEERWVDMLLSTEHQMLWESSFLVHFVPSETVTLCSKYTATRIEPCYCLHKPFWKASSYHQSSYHRSAWRYQFQNILAFNPLFRIMIRDWPRYSWDLVSHWLNPQISINQPHAQRWPLHCHRVIMLHRIHTPWNIQVLGDCMWHVSHTFRHRTPLASNIF